MNTAERKPRIGLMGEFSAGKSTLSNLLLGARPLPEKVTATRLSPVWLSYGTQAPYRIHLDGQHEPIELNNLNAVPVDETRAIRLFFDSDILKACDLIDFPGISDPNMSAEVWQPMLAEVDAILWCTHATQAWRQSEAAVWQTIPQEVQARSVLLVTRFDKLKTERDRSRVLARLEHETKGLFAATFPISLTQALAAGEDYDAFERSGAFEFVQHFAQLTEGLTVALGGAARPVPAAAQEARTDVPSATAPSRQQASDARTVMPRRVRARSTSNRPAALPAVTEDVSPEAASPSV